MLSTVCPLYRSRLTRVITHTALISDRRYYRPTRVVLSNGDKKPPTTPPPVTKDNSTNERDNKFWELNSINKAEQDAAAASQWLDNIKTEGSKREKASSEESEEGKEGEEGEEGKEGEETGQVEDKETARMEAYREDRVVKEGLALVKKYQKKGMWDDTAARFQINEMLGKKREKLRTKEDFDSPESAQAQNQTYAVGDYTLSIEHSDEAHLRRHNEHVTELAGKSQEPTERKEEEIFADSDPELIDALLDRPSQIDKTIARKKGEEILEFDDQAELEAIEANKGKPVDEKTTKSRSDILKNRKRGPAITKNEHGADNITLLYDEEPPSDREITKFHDPLKRLKFLPIYPAKVRKWVTYMRQCKGRYDKWGYWENDVKLQEQENETREHLKIRARQLGDTGMLLMSERRKRQTLPPDLDGHYRFGVQPDELIGVHPKVKELLSFKHANNFEIHSFRKQQHIKRWQERPDDHGTPQVQIACMTTRANYLTEHLKKNKKDKPCRLELRKLLSRRQSMLKYLRRTNVPVYYQIVRELDIQDVSF